MQITRLAIHRLNVNRERRKQFFRPRRMLRYTAVKTCRNLWVRVSSLDWSFTRSDAYFLFVVISLTLVGVSALIVIFAMSGGEGRYDPRFHSHIKWLFEFLNNLF